MSKWLLGKERANGQDGRGALRAGVVGTGRWGPVAEEGAREEGPRQGLRSCAADWGH